MVADVKVIADSISPSGDRLTTLQLRYWRAIHGEFMTHRTFCLAGDAMLDFDLPAGSQGNGARRKHSMSLREFVDKWMNGAAQGKSSRHSGKMLDHLDSARLYSAREIAKEIGHKSTLNINNACRNGDVVGARKHAGEWVATGQCWAEWRGKTGSRRFSIRDRLSKMRIRQFNERTGEVQTSTVKNCIASGVKEVFRVSAGDFSVCGSKDHRILTESGWKRIEDIVPGVDRVVAYTYGTGTNANPNRHNKIDGKWVQTWSRQNRDAVAKRQGGMCAVSGAPLAPSFHLHHVEPRHARPDLAFDINNVIAVNADAHKDMHEVQGWQTGVPLGAAGVLVDSVQSEGLCDTYDLEIAGEFPNFFADGVVVHNSRNASSSRAVPVMKTIAQVLKDPAGPIHWGQNRPGMQAKSELDGLRRKIAKGLWRAAGVVAAGFAWGMVKVGLHKQVANRILEPWQYIHVVLTSTEWENFFELRLDEDAQPEFRELAQAVKDALDNSTPTLLAIGEWHLPYVTPEDREYVKSFAVDEEDYWNILKNISAARCCRVSFLKHNGLRADVHEDLSLCGKLVGARPLHASPFEHQATPDRYFDQYTYTPWGNPSLHGNLVGWIQNRKIIERDSWSKD